MKKFNTMTTGQIVACNYQYAAIFRHYGIDFCCQGNVPLKKACEKAGIDSRYLEKNSKKKIRVPTSPSTSRAGPPTSCLTLSSNSTIDAHAVKARLSTNWPKKSFPYMV